MESIGQVADLLGVSQHTLRYYEKIGLLSNVSKNGGGRRQYDANDIKQVRFIKRAQRMHFSLEEIRELINLERGGSNQKPQARQLVTEKLDEIEDSLKDLKQLKNDLSKMLSACISSGDDEDCPIIVGIKDTSG